MNAFQYTLLADGPSDRCLIWIINWLLDGIPEVSHRGYVSYAADLWKMAAPPHDLADRMLGAVNQFPCDVLFIHRDAEKQPFNDRLQEIRAAAANFRQAYIPVVPVHMTEAWLLLDESAIRKAADNPNGASRLALPGIAALERLPDPKETLFELLISASEKNGRRKEQFKRDLPRRRQRVAELIRDFSPLRQLPAFQSFESEFRRVVATWIQSRNE